MKILNLILIYQVLIMILALIMDNSNQFLQ